MQRSFDALMSLKYQDRLHRGHNPESHAEMVRIEFTSSQTLIQ
jgi:hypothetical protein